MRRTAAPAARDPGAGSSRVTLQLDHIRVHDAMREGILSCDAEAKLCEVGGIVATHRVHAVAITDGDRTRSAGVVPDLDRAAQLMAEHGISHLVVLDAAHGHRIGALSTLDIACVYAAEGDG